MAKKSSAASKTPAKAPAKAALSVQEKEVKEVISRMSPETKAVYDQWSEELSRLSKNNLELFYRHAQQALEIKEQPDKYHDEALQQLWGALGLELNANKYIWVAKHISEEFFAKVMAQNEVKGEKAARITVTHLLHLANIADPKAQDRMLKAVIREKMTVRELQQEVRALTLGNKDLSGERETRGLRAMPFVKQCRRAFGTCSGLLEKFEPESFRANLAAVLPRDREKAKAVLAAMAEEMSLAEAHLRDYGPELRAIAADPDSLWADTTANLEAPASDDDEAEGEEEVMSLPMKSEPATEAPKTRKKRKTTVTEEPVVQGSVLLERDDQRTRDKKFDRATGAKLHLDSFPPKVKMGVQNGKGFIRGGKFVLYRPTSEASFASPRASSAKVSE